MTLGDRILAVAHARTRWPRGGHRTVAVAVIVAAVTLGITGSALGASPTTTFSAIQTIPVPPASNYAGSGGGDGWAIALSSTQVFNVFHHQSTLTVACHEQSDATPCWSPRTITDPTVNVQTPGNFASSGHPGLYLDQQTGKLYVYATRTSDDTGGVVCIDTTIAATNPDPFCGFTALTPVGGASFPGLSAISGPALVGARWYAFNYVSSAAAGSGKNQLLCFDVSTLSACANQPFDLAIGSGQVSDGAFPPPGVAAIGHDVIVAVTVGQTDELACFDDTTQAVCSGSWPTPLGFSYDTSAGDPFPLLSSTGEIQGVCLPTGTDQCFDLTGATVATPAGMTGTITRTSGWNGPAFVIGPRVYVADGNTAQVECYDYSTSASCANFPKTMPNLGLLYTVNPDPQRPACIWVNSDDGSSQIQSFDAFSGGPCGQGAIRVLASQFVVHGKPCEPASYRSLQVLTPAPGSYRSGTVSFDDSDGNSVSGAPQQPLDGTGTVDLTGLNLNGPLGLPQFLISLTGVDGAVGSVVVKLTWTGTYDPSCIGAGTTVAQTPTTTTMAFVSGSHTVPTITVPAGAPVTGAAALAGTHAGAATGAVTYAVYSDSACTRPVQTLSPQAISQVGSPPQSGASPLASPGTYYWTASYSGDGANFGSQSGCGSAVETVVASPPSPEAGRAGGSAVETVVASPPSPKAGRAGGSAPALSGSPSLSGLTKAGHTLSCSTGSWTESPTGYTYHWYRNNKLIANVTGATYLLSPHDKGSNLTCVVTAVNAFGATNASSTTIKIPVALLPRCPSASGRMTGNQIGPVRLGLNREQTRRRFRHHASRGRRYEDFLCLTPIGVRVGYASPRLLKTLPASTRREFTGRVVWASTSNPYYSLDGIAPGSSLGHAARILGPGRVFHIGPNYWYVVRARDFTVVLKVGHGMVEEVGIADSSLTAPGPREAALMHSFY